MTFFSNNAPLLLLLGLLTAIIVILLPAPVSITNGLKGSRVLTIGFIIHFGVFGLLAWLIPPQIGFFIGLFYFGFFGFLAWTFYSQKKGEQHSPNSLLYLLSHTPLTLHYWMTYVVIPKVLRTHKSKSIKIGLSAQYFDLSKEPNRANDLNPLVTIEKSIYKDALEKLKSLHNSVKSHGALLRLPNYDEITFVAGGEISEDTVLTVHVYAPSFKITPESRTATIKTLSKEPLEFVIFTEYDGDQELRIEYTDAGGLFHGGLTIPLRIRDRYPMVSQKLSQVLTLMATILAVPSALFLVVEKSAQFGNGSVFLMVLLSVCLIGIYISSVMEHR